MLTCKDISETATDHLEGKTSSASRLKFRLHLLYCKNCRRYYRQIQLTISTLQKLPKTVDSKGFPDDAEIDLILQKLKEKS
jgi:predicted anti-sigma-YlaC factor YlaD